MFAGPKINVNEVEYRLADLRKRHQAVLKGRDTEALSTEEKSICTNILAQIGFANEQLREHKAGAYFDNNKQPGDFRLVADTVNEDVPHTKTISRFLQGMFASATQEQQEEIRSLAGYLRGQPLATNLSPSADGV